MSHAAVTSPHGSRRWHATGIGILGICLWATETVLASFTRGLPPFQVTGLAFAAAALLSPLVWWLSGDHPRLAFRQPWWVWAITVPSLVAYHACIYFAVHKAPAAPAALLQGCTPLFLVFGSAFLGGQRLRWWHIAGAAAGLEGLVALSLDGNGLTGFESGTSPILLLIGLAAGLWGLYSLLTSRFASVPTSAMGVFYMAASAMAMSCHAGLERWVMPTGGQWIAICALGLLPMGLALLCWDFGLKKGDVQALGAASYVEPLIGAGLVVALGQGDLRWSMLISSIVILGGAVLGAADMFEEDQGASKQSTPLKAVAHQSGSMEATCLSPALRKRMMAAAARAGIPIEQFVGHCLEAGLVSIDYGARPGRKGFLPSPRLQDGRRLLDGG